MILNVTDQGEGAPIVLLHGLFGRAQNLGALARRLAARARVISLDVRNHGASGHAPGMDYRTLAGDVLETMSALSIPQAALLGHSMGGKAAMAAALMSPSRISRLLVEDVAPVAYDHHTIEVARAMQAIPLHASLTRTEAMGYLQRAVPDATVRAFLLQNLQLAAKPFWRIGLQDIADAIPDIETFPQFPGGTRYMGPALFVAGARSDYIGAADHATIKALFPNAMVETIPDAGHWLHADQPELFGAIAERFLLDDPAFGMPRSML
jgi:pimeloyl-ACP methyl ester carboxylesterase